MWRKIPGTSHTDEAISEWRLKSNGEEEADSKGDEGLAAVCRVRCRRVGTLRQPAHSQYSHTLRTRSQTLPCPWRGDTLVHRWWE